MDRESVRLEILKLVNRHDHTAEMMIAKAKLLEGYVFGDSKQAQSKTNEKGSSFSKSNKKSDTADVLS